MFVAGNPFGGEVLLQRCRLTIVSLNARDVPTGITAVAALGNEFSVANQGVSSGRPAPRILGGFEIDRSVGHGLALKLNDTSNLHFTGITATAQARCQQTDGGTGHEAQSIRSSRTATGTRPSPVSFRPHD